MLVASEALEVNNGVIFASDMERNNLCKYDLTIGKCTCVGIFPGVEIDYMRIHCAAVNEGERVSFLPNRAGIIHKYDTQNGSIEAIPLKEGKGKRFITGVLYRDYYVMVQNAPVGGVCFYKKDGSLEKEIVFDVGSDGFIPLREMIFENDYLYLISKMSKNIIEIDLQNKTKEVYAVCKGDNSQGGFGTILKIDDCFYLSSQNGVTIWDKKNGETNNYTYPDEIKKMMFSDREIIGKINLTTKNTALEQPFSTSIVLGDRIAFLPQRVNISLSFSLLNKEIVVFDEVSEKETIESISRKGRVTHCRFIGSDPRRRFIISTMTRRLYTVDTSGIGYIELNMDGICWTVYTGVGIAMEESSEDVSMFIEAIVEDKCSE